VWAKTRSYVSRHRAPARGLKFARRHALDDPPLGALQLLDGEPLGIEELHGLAQQVMGLEPGEQRIQQALASPDDRDRTPHMLQKKEPTPGPEDTPDPGDDRPVVRNRAETERADDRIERFALGATEHCTRRPR